MNGPELIKIVMLFHENASNTELRNRVVVLKEELSRKSDMNTRWAIVLERDAIEQLLTLRKANL